MSTHHLGETRSRLASDHMLQTPDTFVWAPLPGMVNATACVHAAPALGAAFTQYTAKLQAGGRLGPTSGSRFVYTLSGAAEIDVAGERHTLQSGGYAFLPTMSVHTVAASMPTTLVVIDKRYIAMEGVEMPALLIGNVNNVAPTPLNGDDALQVRTLLPGDATFDFAVNTMEYQPGASLSMTEVHVMEHGLLMLEGEGIYRLGDAWYPVRAGDFIWMAPFCPQWFAALGKVPATYLIYKNWNRHPAEEAR